MIGVAPSFRGGDGSSGHSEYKQALQKGMEVSYVIKCNWVINPEQFDTRDNEVATA